MIESYAQGFIIGHISPEAQVGGPIALIKTGDLIEIDVTRRSIQVDLTLQEWKDRQACLVLPPFKASSGTLHKFIKNVNSASLGCTTDQ